MNPVTSSCSILTETPARLNLIENATFKGIHFKALLLLMGKQTFGYFHLPIYNVKYLVGE